VPQQSNFIDPSWSQNQYMNTEAYQQRVSPYTNPVSEHGGYQSQISYYS